MVQKRRAAVDRAACVACGCCRKACPKQAVEIFRGLYALVDPARCVGCGRCVPACPASIITLKEAAE